MGNNERTNSRQRQDEGSATAKARGVQFGRDPRPLPENFWTAYEAWKAKRMTIQEAAKACGLPRSTFYDKVQKHEMQLRIQREERAKALHELRMQREREQQEQKEREQKNGDPCCI